MIEPLLLRAVGDRLSSEENPTELKPTQTTEAITWVIVVVLGLLAFRVSWTCNTKRNISFGMKVFYGIFAVLFGSLYLVMYAFMTWGYCCPPVIGPRRSSAAAITPR